MKLRLILSFIVLSTFTLLHAQDEEVDSAAIMGLFNTLFDPNAVEVLPEYRFDHGIHYKATKVDFMDAVENEEYDLYFRADAPYIGMATVREEEGKRADLFVAFDHVAKSMATFVSADTVRACMRMKMPEFGKEKKGPKFKKTGRQRNIAGMETVEWLAEEDGEETRLWVAESTVGDMGAIFHAFGDLHGKGSIERGEFGEGMVLAGSVKRKDADKPHYEFEATEVRLNAPFVFRNEGYQMM